MEEAQAQQFDINTVFDNADISNTIEQLESGRITTAPVISDIEKEYKVANHKIFDTAIRRDKIIETNDGTNSVKVNRIGVPVQKRIVNSAVNFLFATPVTLSFDTKDANEIDLINAIKRVYHENKIGSFDRKIARALFSSTEVAEIWYATKLAEKSSSYGFDTDMKIRSIVVSPWNGNELFPYFDSSGDMLAFSRKYTLKNADNKNEVHFECYTDKKIVFYKQTGTDWTEEKNIPNPYGKIPVIYASQAQTEWADVQTMIDRLETLLSNFAETNDYHADPKIVVKGEIKEWSQKGESGAVIEIDEGAEASYLSWDHAPESVKMEIETLLRLIYSMTQTHDDFYEIAKSISTISGIALKVLLTDAYLKVQDKREIFDEYLQRRINVLSSMFAVINPKFKAAAKTVEITPVITPFSITNDADVINNLLAANGNMPIISQKASIEELGWAKNADEELAQIQKEQNANNTLSVFPPVK